MQPAPTLLTKSRFKIALECPTKLFYDSPSRRYRNRNESNDFLRGLAEGGYQVGELAKFMFHPSPIAAGITVDTLDTGQAVTETLERLRRPGRQVIAEAALKADSFLIRVDLLIVDPDAMTAEIIEVKSKSASQAEIRKRFKGSRGRIKTEWIPYLYDIAFQCEVAQRALPEFTILPRLVLLDSGEATEKHGLHQFFRILPVQQPCGRTEL